VPRSTFCFGLTETLVAARRFFERAIELHGVPETITIDKSGAMIKKGQLDRPKAHVSTAASQFYSLATYIGRSPHSRRLMPLLRQSRLQERSSRHCLPFTESVRRA